MIIKNKLNNILLLALFILGTWSSTAHAQVQNPAPGILAGWTLAQLIVIIVQIGMYLAGGVAVIFLLIGSFQYITSRGNEEGLEKAKKTITGAIIGIVIISLALAIVVMVNKAITTGLV